MKFRISRKLKLLGITAALFGGITAPLVAESDEGRTVSVALEGSYAPWNMTAPGGKMTGFEPELLEDLCRRIALRCVPVAQDFDGLIPGLQAGKFDVLMDALAITPEREQAIAFSRPYASTPASFAVTDLKAVPPEMRQSPMLKLAANGKSNGPEIDQLRRELKGRTIGLQSGTVYTKFVTENFRDVATIRMYKTSGERDVDLAIGRIDVAFDDVTYYAGVSGVNGATKLTLVGPQIGGTVWGPGEGLGFRKQDAALRVKFDTAIAAAIADGTVSRLSQKWFHVDVKP